MKLLRYGPAGHEKPGLLDGSGAIRDLSGHVPDLEGAHLAPDSLRRLAALDPERLPRVAGAPRLGPPVAGTRQFIAVGMNYFDHAAQSGTPVPAEPVLFTKAASCIQGAFDPVRRPRGGEKLDWEVELGIVIGSRTSYVAEAAALDGVAGFLAVDDLSERAFQFERGGTVDKGKGCETFGPIGPWLVTRDEVGDVQELGLWLDVNGQRRQAGTTRNMIFSCAALVSYISRFMVLLPGDIITSGTPPGPGHGMTPPRYLEDGDVIELGIDRLGAQRHRVIAWDTDREGEDGSNGDR